VVKVPYTTVERVRALSGLTASDIADVELASLISEADRLVENFTGRTWTGSESDYALAGFASSCFTIALAYLRLVKEEGKSDSWWKKGMDVCEKLKISISVG
jgi:hypothetical protein